MTSRPGCVLWSTCSAVEACHFYPHTHPRAHIRTYTKFLVCFFLTLKEHFFRIIMICIHDHRQRHVATSAKRRTTLPGLWEVPPASLINRLVERGLPVSRPEMLILPTISTKKDVKRPINHRERTPKAWEGLIEGAMEGAIRGAQPKSKYSTTVVTTLIQKR